MLVEKVLNLQEEGRSKTVIADDPTLSKIEEEIIAYAAANPYSDTYVITFSKEDYLSPNRKAIMKHLEEEGFKVFTTKTNKHFQMVVKWQIL